VEYRDIVVAGGGPGGLAGAIAAAQRGLRVLVLERRSEPVDKACGEGLLPPALEALKLLGVRHLIDPAQCFPFSGIELHNEDGSYARAELPSGGGLGVPRVALVSALLARAGQLGVEVRDRCAVAGFNRQADAVIVETSHGPIRTGLLIAADGLRSPLRRLAGLEAKPRGPRRFGIRRHFRVAPWSTSVEVHFGAQLEAYVTPLGPQLVGVAFLWEHGHREAAWSNFIANFPALAERLRGAEPDSKALGAGPMSQRSRAWIAPRLVLLGDAGGYVDAITGEGLSLAFGGALALGRILPRALARGSSASALAQYQREVIRSFRRSALATRLMLTLARRPALRRRVIRGLGRHAWIFESVLGWSLAEVNPRSAPAGSAHPTIEQSA
jgi:menaquinone-9 beta-reductase